MELSSPHGPTVWSSPEWLETAVEWIDLRLADGGLARAGPVEQHRIRPWGTILRVPAGSDWVWFKAAAPATAFEAPLYPLLQRLAADWVLAPLGIDAARGWMLLPDGGLPIREQLEGEERVEAFSEALIAYAELQRALMPAAQEMIGLGVEDMRAELMPHRFREALAAVRAETANGNDGELRRTLDRVEAMAATHDDRCRRLAASKLPPSLDHNDLHYDNVIGDSGSGFRFYDWGDAVLAHPFSSMLVPASIFRSTFDAGLDDPRYLRARDGYLGVFSDLAPAEDLVETLELACHVAKVARALTWNRALDAARQAGEDIPEEWRTAPLESLAAVLDEAYSGGA